jgi:hypothetical protein
MKKLLLPVILLCMVVGCQEQADRKPDYQGFLRRWERAVHEVNADELNVLEQAEKTPEEYAEIYREYYFRNLTLAKLTETAPERLYHADFFGTLVDRDSGVEEPFRGEAEIVRTAGGDLKIKSRVIYRSR